MHYMLSPVGDRDTSMHAIGVSTGEPQKLWMKKTSGDVETAVTAAKIDTGEILLYFGSDDKYIYAVNEHERHITWSYLTGYIARSTPVFANDMVIAGRQVPTHTHTYTWQI